MAHKTFGEFVDRKKRDTIKHLKLLKKVLESKGFTVQSFVSNDESPSYIYCHNPDRNAEFQGIRVYEILGKMAFRVQNEATTHPYGSAYSIPVEDMYTDFLSEDEDEAKAGKKVIEAIVNEVKRFFERSNRASIKLGMQDVEKEPKQILGALQDYSSMFS